MAKKDRGFVKTFGVFGVIISLLLMNCETAGLIYKFEPPSSVKSAQILNLQQLGNSNIPENGFFDPKIEKYGYYHFAIKEYDNGEDDLNSLNNGWFLLQTFTLFIPSFIGVPTVSNTYNLTAYLDIYDSNGEKILVYEAGDTITQVRGLYYGYKKKDISKTWLKLFQQLQEKADRDAAGINQALQAAGPITAEKSLIALDIELRKNQSARNEDYYIPNFTPSAPAARPSTPDTASPSSAPALWDGTYKRSDSRDHELVLISSPFKQVTYKMNGSPVAQGFYQINGAVIIIEYTQFYGDFELERQLRGKKLVYNITSDMTFSGNGQSWVR